MTVADCETLVPAVRLEAETLVAVLTPLQVGDVFDERMRMPVVEEPAVAVPWFLSVQLTVRLPPGEGELVDSVMLIGMRSAEPPLDTMKGPEY